MAQDIDNLPIYDPILEPKTNRLSNDWQNSLATFIQTLQDYLSQNGIFVPKMTTNQRDDLQNVSNGQLIYNTTDEKFQGYENGSWQNLI